MSEHPRRHSSFVPVLGIGSAVACAVVFGLPSTAHAASELASQTTSVLARAGEILALAPSPEPAPIGTGIMARFEQLTANPLASTGLRALGAILVLVVGWILAKLASYGVFQLLSRTELDNKVADKLGISMLLRGDKPEGDDSTQAEGSEQGAIERSVAKVVYYVLMLLVVVGALQAAGLSQVAGPIENLVNTVVQALPRVGKAALILVVAYFAGRILEMLAGRSLDRLGIDARLAKLADQQGAQPMPFSQTAGRVIFWLLMLLGLAGAFESLEIGPLASPLHNAIDQMVGILPHVGVAVVLVGAGYLGGRIVRALARNALNGLGFDGLVAKLQLDKLIGKSKASDLVATALMLFVIAQASIAALNEVGLETLSGPLTDMMSKFWNLLPSILVSVVILVLAVFVGKLLRGLVAGALSSLGLNRFMQRMGFEKLSERDDKLGEYSEIVGFVAQIGVVLLGIAQALDNLALDTWSVYVNLLLAYVVKNVAVATLVVGVGFALASYVRDLVQARGDDEASRWLGEFARYAVLVFAFTMGVQQLGVAPDFVLLTFGLLFGALCLGAALAFGLGGREVAGEIVKRRYSDARTRMLQRKAAPKVEPKSE